MENAKSVKALKKQLVAAIAMVLVAAVALASSTYAWFVSNNSVKGTTTNISAQSNSAYLVIDKQKTSKDSKTEYSFQTEASVTKTALYPAQVIAAGKWQSAYASDPTKADEKADTRFDIKADGKKDASAEAAVAAGYAITHKFYIGTGTYDGTFENLKVKEIKLSAPDADIADAMRVLVKCGDNWQVWDKNGQVKTYKTTEAEAQELTGQSEVIAARVSKGNDAVVDVYVYYDGADGQIKSDNLDNLGTGCGVTITFEATPTEYGKTTK